MFEDALLESSPRRRGVLCRVHYTLSIFTGVLFFALGFKLVRFLLPPADERALFVIAAMLGSVAALTALMLCYVWASKEHAYAWPWLALTLALNLPGFLIYLIYAARKTGDWKRAAMPLAYIAESILLGALVLIPLIYTQALPKELLIGEIHISPPPGPSAVHASSERARPSAHPMVDLSAAPTRIPMGIMRIVESPVPALGSPDSGFRVIGGVTGGQFDGGLNNILGNLPSGDSLPPPAPQPVAHKQPMVRVGGDVIAARALYQPPPVYPPLAMTARVQGRVVLQAIIGKDGTVQDLKVLSGHPLLVRAAMDAVKTWRYQPTLLNSEPVDVLTEIDVNFRLSD